MTTEQINQLFEQKIHIKGIHKVLEIDTQQITNYRRRSEDLSLGKKMELLLKMGEIIVLKTDTSEIKDLSVANHIKAQIALNKLLEKA